MAQEIERKYLVTNDSYKAQALGNRHIVQAYLSTSPDATVRLRVIDNQAFITIKSRTVGCTRGEWEYEIPVVDAMEMIDRCNISNIIAKTRYYVKIDNHTWEIDEFEGRLQGLVLAEIELTATDEQFTTPSFVGKEVTTDPRYYNSSLSTTSFSDLHNNSI